MKIISYHNFTFPFQWCINGKDQDSFPEQTDLNSIDYAQNTNWQRVDNNSPCSETDGNVLYDERNYFYQFIHNALYDNGGANSLIHHFERLEPQLATQGRQKKVVYRIDTEGKSYELTVGAINLNLYTTGVGILSFYLYNDRYPDEEDVLRINQKGRRIFPPYIGSVDDRKVIADCISIEGLHGKTGLYSEDFTSYKNTTGNNEPARFVKDMIFEIAQNIHINPVVDDRMFVACWYKNDNWANAFSGNGCEEFIQGDRWFEFVSVDELYQKSCRNHDMQKELIGKATYRRWQEDGTLCGITRNSMMCATRSDSPDHYLNTFETIYARMAELILVQRASVLRFSAEITNINSNPDDHDFSHKVQTLYKEYIRFVNQIHFTEVTAQTPGIELYWRLFNSMNLGRQVDKLDNELQELYNYVTLQEESNTNKTMNTLTWIATFLLPITVVAGIFGMNNQALNGEGDGTTNNWYNHFGWQFIIIAFAIVLGICILRYLQSKNKKNSF